MNLGGNLPDSLSGYLEMGHDEESIIESKDKEAKEVVS